MNVQLNVIMSILQKRHYISCVCLIFLFSCRSETKKPDLFHLLTPQQTGITFVNSITTNETKNYQTDAFIYHGAGVATGDINNDGLPDVFLSGNEVQSRLYLNKGDMKFEDITESAGITLEKRATGVSMVDINSDGYLDIYVTISGAPDSAPDERSNVLFLNNGDNTFTETAHDLNIDDPGFGIHSVFFDYNDDGYLDLFVLNNSDLIHVSPTQEDHEQGVMGRSMGRVEEPDPYGFDQLYRNNGDGTFTNVSEEAGILKKIGYGLGVVATDLNGDDWPDIYVSNDVTPNDVLYINNRDGTFSDKAAEYLKHTSFSGMGIDIADFTNNGWPDILQTDMMPEELSGRKRMSGSVTYDGFQQLRQQGFYPHYNLNTLQFNHGVNQDGDLIFSEIAQLAGVSYTDWSWSALFGDYDNDGFKDIFITNGYPKAVNDYDYLMDIYNIQENLDNVDQQTIKEREYERLNNLHDYKVPNYIFRNNGNTSAGNHTLKFTDKTDEWILDDPGYSYGAAYADLNNNGRLDLIINNINAPAQIYENRDSEDDTSNYLQVRLQGDHPNMRGIGSKFILSSKDQKQFIYHTPYRGYMSTMDDRVHFGLGEAEHIDSLEILWPDGRYQLLTNLDANQVLTIHQENSVTVDQTNLFVQQPENKPFRTIHDDIGLTYKHEEKNNVDYNTQPLLPYMISRQGPPVAVGDVTGNGLDDVYIGGISGIAGKLFVQQENGSFMEFSEMQPWSADSAYEDWGALFFDANGDAHLDLYVNSGGYRVPVSSDLLQDRLYINQGDGRFIRDTEALPEMRTSTATVTAGDFTGDGFPDLFVGGRVTPYNYPKSPRSYLLRNDGGRFTDITEKAAPELSERGMITDAVWIDYDQNGQMDLATAGEWMSIEFYENDGTSLRNITESMNLPPLTGWWFSLKKGDLTNNGYDDLVVGNLGENYSYKTSGDRRFGIYAADFSGNYITDIILTEEINGKEFPFYGFAKLGREISNLSIPFKTFEQFSGAPIQQMFSSKQLNAAFHRQTDIFASIILKNGGDGSFQPVHLPAMAQISPVNGIVTHDVDKDGNLDLIMAGNLFHAEPTIPRADGGNGLWLKGDGQGNFDAVSTMESGFYAPLDVKNLELLRTVNGHAVIVANNNDSLSVFGINYLDQSSQRQED